MKVPRVMMNTPAFLAGVFLAAGSIVTFAVPEVAHRGLFELDSNATESDDPGGDWGTLFDGGGQALAFTGVLADPAPVSIFTGGGSQDVRDLTQWRHTDGRVTDHEDIANAYAAAYVYAGAETGVHSPGDLIITFGLDRFGNNGDFQSGFWFLQDEVALADDGTFIGQHREGDLLVLVEYPQGAGAIPMIDLYAWDRSAKDNLRLVRSSQDASTPDPRCGGAGQQAVCAIIHDGTETAPWPYIADFPDPSFPDDFPPETSLEGRINVSAVLGGEVPCFSRFLAETRRSHSETGELKDFVLGRFDTCDADIRIDKECIANLNSAGDAVVVSFRGTVTNTGDVALDNVTVVDDSGTPGDTADDQRVLGPLTLAPGASQAYSGSYTTPRILSADVVTAGASDALTGSPVSASASATCVVEVEPIVTVTKSCRDPSAFGEPIAFDGTVSNTGNVVLSDVTLVDDGGTPDDTSDDATVLGPLILPRGAVVAFNGTHAAPVEGPSTDTVTVGAVDILTFTPIIATASATCVVPPPSGDQGCSPGFWKNRLESWSGTGFSPEQSVGAIFRLQAGSLNTELGEDALLTALGYHGGNNLVGAARNLLRAAVASVLNAAHPGVEFNRTVTGVVTAVNTALATTDRATILALAEELDEANNLGCDL